MRALRSSWRFPVAVVLVLAANAVTARQEITNADLQLLKTAGVGNDGPSVLDFFRKRTVTETDLNGIKELIRQLGDESFFTRQKASASLVARGAVCVPLLRA